MFSLLFLLLYKFGIEQVFGVRCNTPFLPLPQLRKAIFSLLETLSVELAQHMSSVIWSLWKHRNLRVWDDFTETSATVVERASNRLATG